MLKNEERSGQNSTEWEKTSVFLNSNALKFCLQKARSFGVRRGCCWFCQVSIHAEWEFCSQKESLTPFVLKLSKCYWYLVRNIGKKHLMWIAVAVPHLFFSLLPFKGSAGLIGLRRKLKFGCYFSLLGDVSTWSLDCKGWNCGLLLFCLLTFCLNKFATQKQGGRGKGCFELLNCAKQLPRLTCEPCNQIEFEGRVTAMTSG